MDTQAIRALKAQQQPGFALTQPFYRDPAIHERDVERIFMRAWLYAGHVSEIPRVGDYFLFELANESVIIVRSTESDVSALVNVCRHRGSRVCVEAAGNAPRLTCRYHAWTYALDGELQIARTMPDSFDKSDYGLRKIHVEVFDGMIFVNFADQPGAFGVIRDDLSDCLAPYRLENAKVAHRHAYGIDANWKLSVENYTECYHCAPAHREYSLAHSLAIPESRHGEEMAAVMARAGACGLSDKVVNHLFLEAGEFGTDRSYERYPLLRGHVTGSADGKPVAPLMGDIRAYDQGTTDFQIGPVTFGLAYCDHIVIYRFTPVDVQRSVCDITWLVNGDAVEGRDYDRERLTWLWDVTTIADQHIIERNQEGVNSRFYQPGPYSEMEAFTSRFVAWYLDAID